MNRMKLFLYKHRRLVGLLGAGAAFVIAIMYLTVLAPDVSEMNIVPQVILQYGHSVCWFLLSGASFLWATYRKTKWAAILANAAFVTYGLFIITFLLTTGML
jgi:hypothetical protein